jgi:S-adenosylmethionine-dependent methyltransferase
MAEPRRRHRSRSVTDALLTELVTGLLREWKSNSGLDDYAVTDLGGGTGTFAIALAEAGRRVTVVDPNLDALASLQRRTAERGLDQRLRGVQGDASDLVQLVGPASTDVMICHRTLEVVDDPADALRAMAQVVRPGGVLSLVVPQRRAAVLTQAIQGHLGAALQAIDDPSRFDLAELEAMITDSGFRVEQADGLSALAHHVPAAALETEPGLLDQLYELETRVSQDPAFRAIAPWVHVFAAR